MSKFYTGVGSRETPEDVLRAMTAIAAKLDSQGWTLRSGHAPGADQAFEAGTENAQVFKPWPTFEENVEARGLVYERPRRDAYDLAEQYHPAWHRCKRAVRALHARNVHQVLGYGLDTPSKFLICWTPDALVKGGTATAIRLAQDRGIPVFNLAAGPARKRLDTFLRIPDEPSALAEEANPVEQPVA